MIAIGRIENRSRSTVQVLNRENSNSRGSNPGDWSR